MERPEKPRVDDAGDKRRWGTEQRLEFIEFRLFWEGGVNRGDITSHFGVSVPQASNDLSRYKELAGDNIQYDASEKRYLPTANFHPRFIKPTADRYLAQLKAVADGILGANETPAPGAHVEEGVADDVVYVGAVTRYHVTLDRGGEVQVVSQNLATTSSEVQEARGRRVRLQWRPEQESVIDENGREP